MLILIAMLIIIVCEYNINYEKQTTLETLDPDKSNEQKHFSRKPLGFMSEDCIRNLDLHNL